MKRLVFAIIFAFAAFSSFSQSVPFPPNPGNTGKLEPWGYQQVGTNWDTSPYLPFFYNQLKFRLMPPNGVTYNKTTKTWTNAVPGKKYPLILFFHGNGEAGTDNNNQLKHGGQKHRDAILSGAFPGFAFYPQSVTVDNAKFMLERLIVELPVDINQIYVHGLSGGGDKSWQFTRTYQTLIAGAFPMSATDAASKTTSMLYQPLRESQGALDTNPSPSQTQPTIDWFAANGGHLEFFFLQGVGHGTWDAMYNRADFFPWFLAQKKNKIMVRFDRNLICPESPISVDMGFTPGFDAYEWRKDGALISGQTAAKLIATSYGSYTGRIKNRGVWSEWSDPIVVGQKQPTNTPPITANGLKSVVLPAPDGSTTTELALPDGYASYSWKNASNQVVSTSRIFTGVPVGSYTATANEVNGCATIPSPAFNVLAASGTNKPDAVVDFLGYATSVSQITLAWTDKPSPTYNETGFEVYRAANPAGPYTLIAMVAANGLGYNDSNLTPNTTYSYKVRPVNQYSAGPTSEVVSVLTQVDNVAPTAPSNLVSSAVNPASVNFTWTGSTDNVGVFKYDVYRDGQKVLATASTSATIYNLVEGQVYKFVVKARDMTGNSSTESNQVMVSTTLAGLSYKYYEATSFGPNLPDFNTLTPVETGFSSNIDLTVRNRTTQYAFMWQGMINIPVAGSYVFGTNSDEGSNLYIGGYDPSFKVVDNDGSHSSRDREGTKVFSSAGVYPIVITYYQATGSAAMTIFWRNTASGQVSKVNIPTAALSPADPLGGVAPQAPSNLVVTTASFDKLNLTWTDNSSNENGFRVYRSLNGTSGWLPVGTTSANATTYQDQSLAANTKYYYRVVAYGNFGESAYSLGVPRGLDYAYYEAANMTSLTLIPTLTPVKLGTSTWPDPALRLRSENMALKWNGKINITTAATYTFYTSSDDGSNLSIDGVQVVSNDNNQNQTEKSGTKSLTVGWHDFQVQWRKRTSSNSRLTVSYSRSGMSKTAITSSNATALFYGTELSATTAVMPPLPAAPTNLATTNPAPTTISLTWLDNATDETSYQVLRSYQQNTNYIIFKDLPAGTTSFLDEGLFANATYYYKVKVIGPGGSVLSGEVSATTANNPPILTALTDISLKYGKVLDLNVYAQDADNDPITLSVTGLPAFASFVDQTGGSGVIHFAPAATPSTLGTYSLVVKAQDNHSGVSTSPFVLTVTDKEAPIILPITNITVSENQSGTGLVQATSDFGAANLIWSFTGLPAFASYTVNSGLASLVLNPGYTDSGPYTVQVTVTDPIGASATKTFTINVNDVNPNSVISVNFVNSTNAATPWNNVAGLTASALKDGTGATTAVGLQFLTNSWLTFNMGAVTGNNSGIFPDNVLQDYYYFGFNGGPETVDVKVNGLDVAKSYNFNFMGSSAFNLGGVTDNGSTVYSIGAQSVTLNVQNNSTHLATISHIAPNPDGTVTFSMAKASGTQVGYINAFTLESIYQDGTVPAAPRNVAVTLNGSATGLTWVDAPFNEDGYDVYRATAAGGPFVKINSAPVAKNGTGYSDNSVQEGNTYYYEVLAFNTAGNSAASNVASIALPNLPPAITVTGDLFLLPNATGQVNVSTTADATLSVTNLPSFATLTQVTPYQVTIALAPGTANPGVYTMSAVATDPQSLTTTQPIAVTISETVLYKVYVNFSLNSSAPAPWNNTAKIPAVNDTFSNLKNDSNVGSGVNLILQTAFGGEYNQGAQTGNDSGVVPDAVLKEYYWFGIFGAAPDVTMKVTGLNAANKYRFKFIASTVFTNGGTISQNGSTVFKIGAATASVDVQANTSRLAIIENVITNAQGEVTIVASKAAGAAAGYINGMIIEALPAGPQQFSPPTGLSASGYSKTQVNLTWSDNSPVETGYEVQRSETGVEASYTTIATTNPDVASYIDAVPVSNKIYYYRVRATSTNGPSAFTNVAKSSAVSFRILVNIAGAATYDAPAPWNNLSRFGFDGDIFVGFKDDTGAPTGLRMRVKTALEGANNWGVVTGNNSGVFPDKVLNSFWFNDAYFPQGEFVIDGLDQTFSYNFGFLGSIVNGTPVNTDFRINGTTVTNRNDSNISNVSYIRNARPDGNSEILFTVKETAGSPWSIWNALVIEGFGTGGNSGARTNQNAQVDGTYREVRYGQASDNMNFYPNPVNAEMNVVIQDASIGEVGFQFYDLMGKEVQQGRFNNDAINTEFRIGVDLSPALYLMKLTYPDGKVETKKFVKN